VLSAEKLAHPLVDDTAAAPDDGTDAHSRNYDTTQARDTLDITQYALKSKKAKVYSSTQGRYQLKGLTTKKPLCHRI